MRGVCASCRKQKYEVHPHKSSLITQIDLLMCRTCIRKGFEPRYIIVLAARSGMLREASHFIVNDLYIGDRIDAKAILVSPN